MSTKYTTQDRVNLRSESNFGNNTRGTLHLCQRVEITGGMEGDRWLPVRVDIGGVIKSGFVSKNVLRDALSDSREALIQATVSEWLRFNRGAGKENQEPYAQYVGEMWRALGMNLDGYDRDTPWSAAFISFVVRKAGGYDGFAFAASHSRYIHKSIQKKIQGADHPFWGYKISQHKVEIGDMVCKWRQNRISYEYATQNQWFKSHCDIVVAIEDNNVLTIGGNVSHSVAVTRYHINSLGYLADEGNIFAVLSNRR